MIPKKKRRRVTVKRCKACGRKLTPGDIVAHKWYCHYCYRSGANRPDKDTRKTIKVPEDDDEFDALCKKLGSTS